MAVSDRGSERCCVKAEKKQLATSTGCPECVGGGGGVKGGWARGRWEMCGSEGTSGGWTQVRQCRDGVCGGVVAKAPSGGAGREGASDGGCEGAQRDVGAKALVVLEA